MLDRDPSWINGPEDPEEEPEGEEEYEDDGSDDYDRLPYYDDCDDLPDGYCDDLPDGYDGR